MSRRNPNRTTARTAPRRLRAHPFLVGVLLLLLGGQRHVDFRHRRVLLVHELLEDHERDPDAQRDLRDHEEHRNVRVLAHDALGREEADNFVGI